MAKKEEAKKEKARRRLKLKRKSRRSELNFQAPRPTRMSHAELGKHRREGHVNFHPGCEHCVGARALSDRHERGENPDEQDEEVKEPTGVESFFSEDSGGAMVDIASMEVRLRALHSLHSKLTAGFFGPHELLQPQLLPLKFISIILLHSAPIFTEHRKE